MFLYSPKRLFLRKPQRALRSFAASDCQRRHFPPGCNGFQAAVLLSPSKRQYPIPINKQPSRAYSSLSLSSTPLSLKAKPVEQVSSKPPVPGPADQFRRNASVGVGSVDEVPPANIEVDLIDKFGGTRSVAYVPKESAEVAAADAAVQAAVQAADAAVQAADAAVQAAAAVKRPALVSG